MTLSSVRRPLRFFLLRHGETDYNRAGIVQGGGIDSTLNEQGRMQAQAFHQQWGQHPFEAVICSGLQRTVQTVEPFLEAGIPLLRYAGLNEISWGVAEGQTRNPETERLFRETLEAWRKGHVHHKVEGGESPEEVWSRASPVLAELARHYDDGGDLLICTHGRTLRILLSQLMGYGLAYMERFSHRNTGLNLLKRVNPDVWVAELLNDTRHLAHLPSPSPDP